MYRLAGAATNGARTGPLDAEARDARWTPIPYAGSVLVVLIPAIWVGVLSFALTMARLAAASDDARAAAIAEHLAALERFERQHTTTDGRLGERRFDRRPEAYARPVGETDERLERDGSKVHIE